MVAESIQAEAPVTFEEVYAGVQRIGAEMKELAATLDLMLSVKAKFGEVQAGVRFTEESWGNAINALMTNFAVACESYASETTSLEEMLGNDDE